MQNAVKKDPSAIGFLSDYFALAKGINPVAYNGTGCSVANVVSGSYPGVSDFYEVTKGPASGRRRGLHLLDPDELDGEEDHREQLDPARQDRAGGEDRDRGAAPHCADPGPTAAPGSCSARWRLLVALAIVADGRVRRGSRVAHVLARGPLLARLRREPRLAGQRDELDERPPAGVGVPRARVAADLRHAADERLRGAPRPRDLAADRDLRRRLRRRAGPSPADGGDPAARLDPLGRLRADRDPRARPVRRQRPRHDGAEGVGHQRDPAHRRGAAACPS